MDLPHICQEVCYTIAGRLMKIKGISIKVFNGRGFSTLEKQSKYREINHVAGQQKKEFVHNPLLGKSYTK